MLVDTFCIRLQFGPRLVPRKLQWQPEITSSVPIQWKFHLIGNHPRSRGFLQFLVSLLRLSSTAAKVLSSCMTFALWKCHCKSLSDLSTETSQHPDSSGEVDWSPFGRHVWPEGPSAVAVVFACVLEGAPHAVAVEEQMCLLVWAASSQHNARLALQMNCYRQPFCLLKRSLPIKAGHSTSLFWHY